MLNGFTIGEVPFEMCVSEASEPNVFRLMRPLAFQRPAVAANILFGAFFRSDA